MSAEVRFFVPGIPQPGGSKKGFVVRTKTGKQRVAIVEDAKHNAPWRAKVALAAAEHFTAPLRGPLEANFEFTMPRPKSHYGTGRRAAVLKPDSPVGHTIPPDTTKLIRSTEDALKGIAWLDDAQVVVQSASKLYGDTPGCWVTVRAHSAIRRPGAFDTSLLLHIAAMLSSRPCECEGNCDTSAPCLARSVLLVEQPADVPPQEPAVRSLFD